MKTIILYFGILLCGASALFAQNNNSSKAKGRIAWFVYTSMPEGVENPVKVMSGKDITDLTLSKRMASDSVKIPQSGILRLVREMQNPDNSKKVNYLTLAQVNIPKKISRALIILMPLKNPEGSLVFKTKVQDLAEFKGGDWLFMNLTKADIGVQLGETKMKIMPNKIRIYDASALGKSTNMPILYSFFHPIKDEWKLISASTVVLRKTRREICIFSADPRFNRIAYHGITFPVVIGSP